MSSHHLAQINIARGRALIDDPIMVGFTEQLAALNALAEASPGFVWRLVDEAGGDATGIRAFTDPRLIVNLSMWTDVAALKAYVYRGQHGAAFRDRSQWFGAMDGPHLALWWIKAGTIPTVAEGKRRLELLAQLGPTAEAFTFRAEFAPPD